MRCLSLSLALLVGAGDVFAVYAASAADDELSAHDFLKRGIRNRMRGKYTAAIYDLTEAIRLDEDIPGLHMARGMAYLDRAMRDDRWDTLRRAEEDFERAVYADVNNGRAYALRGFVRSIRGNQRGIGDIRQAQQIDSALPPEGFAALGVFAMDARAWAQARAFFNKGLSLVAPGFPIRGFIKGKLQEVQLRERKRISTSLTKRRDVETISADQELRELLLTLLDGDPAEREEAAKALGFTGNVNAVGGLIGALQDPVVRVRAQAAASLGVIGSPKGTKALLALITAEDRRFRGVVVRALGEIGSERARKPLTARLKKEKEKVIRNEIRVAIKKIEDAAFTMKMDLEYMLEELSVTLE